MNPGKINLTYAGSVLVMRDEFYLCGLTYSALEMHKTTMKTSDHVPSRDIKKSKREASLSCGWA